jgi:APA family basic amino acid/polyamine antiporter
MLVMLLGQSRVFFSMSRDGLLPQWASAIHPRFRTPWISTIAVGVVVAILPAVLPVGRLAELVNIGTLLAFTIVCAGVWIMRVRHPDLPRPFRTPFVPAVPILGILSALYLMFNLPLITWVVMISWLIVGLFIYFGYSVKHSKVQRLTEVSKGGD